MTVVIPPNAKTYQDAVVGIPARWATNPQPVEGPRFIPYEIDWISYPSGVVACNVQGNTPDGQMSQIVALSVNNIACGGDVTFVFPDTAEVVTVPAYTETTIAVFTNGTAFYVTASGVISGDITRFKCHNVMPPPVSVSASIDVSAGQAANINMSANGAVAIVPGGTNGTLEAFMVTVGNGGAAGSCFLALQDGEGTPLVLWQTFVIVATNAQVVYPMSGLSSRFINGLNLVVSSTTLPGTAEGSANVWYRNL